jgi:hypothetical protein
MQAFGKFITSIDIEYIDEQYIYIQEENETIDAQQLEQMLKKKRKTVAGTIFLYNPYNYPEGYDEKKMLGQQGFDFDDEIQNVVQPDISVFCDKDKLVGDIFIVIVRLFTHGNGFSVHPFDIFGCGDPTDTPEALFDTLHYLVFACNQQYFFCV